MSIVVPVRPRKCRADKSVRPGWPWLLTLAFGIGAVDVGHATTKGLSQIVTPDLQPVDELSISAQVQARAIGNPWQAQFELGLTPRFEVALFQGFSPGEQVLGTEIGLVQRGPWLLSTGFVNWSLGHGSPQPLLEGGYYLEHDKFIAGALRAGAQSQALLGWAHDFNAVWRVQVDYQSGSANYLTAGFTWTPSDRWQVNPALYLANDHTHTRLGYLVATYTIKVRSRQVRE